MTDNNRETVPMEVVESVPTKVMKSPIEMASALIEQKVDPSFVEKMLELQIKHEENEAKKAFHKAMAAFKIGCPDVEKDMHNAQYNSYYTSLGKLVSTISPHMSKHGLTHEWSQETLENNSIKVTFTVTHELAFSKSNSFTAPPDTSGKKNPIQQMRSTVTYLKSITFESGMGLASTEASISDDGNKSHTKPIGDDTVISKEKLDKLRLKMKEKGVTEETIIREFGKKNMWTLTYGNYKTAINKLEKTK
jgi:hypothetical protein